MDKLSDMFEQVDKTHRTCGTCGETKLLDQFYKDGKDSKGRVRYRRDCKDCYKRARIMGALRKGGNNR